MNKDYFLTLVKSDELQSIGMGRGAAYRSLKSEKTWKNSE